MDKLTDALLWQMIMDTIRVVMVVYALGILILLGESITRLEKLIGRLIVRGCKAIWRFIRKLINKQGDVVLEESKVEV